MANSVSFKLRSDELDKVINQADLAGFVVDKIAAVDSEVSLVVFRHPTAANPESGSALWNSKMAARRPA